MGKKAPKYKVLLWGFKLGWEIDKKLLILWYSISICLAVLPAVALRFNREIVRLLSNYLATGTGSYNDIVPYILSYGVVFIFVGLSARANQDFIYMAMYDSYYLGMKDVLLKCFHNIEMVDLLKKDINDEYQAIRARSGSLNDVMSGCCAIVGNIIGIIALLIVAFNISKIVFAISLFYAFAIVKLNTSFIEKLRWNTLEYRKIERLAGYYQTIAKTPGAAKEIRIFNIKNHFISKWQQAYKGILKFEFSRIFSQELRTFLSGLSFYVFLIAMLVYSIFVF